MKCPFVYMTIITAVLVTSGCSSQKGDPVADYFWPLKKGQIFTYELEGGGKHIIKLSEVTQESNGNFQVSTEEEIVETNLPVNAPMKDHFRIDLKNNVIYRSTQSGAAPPKEAIYLKGPIRRGVEWIFSWNFSGMTVIDESSGTSERKTEGEKGTGVCKIEALRAMGILGKEIPCAEAKCTISPKRAIYYNRMFYCKGVGYVGTQASALINGKETEPTWMDKLIEMR